MVKRKIKEVTEDKPKTNISTLHNKGESLNIYTVIPRKYKDLKQNAYKNWDKYKLPVPGQYMISGLTGCGKTQFLINMILGLNCFERIIICAKNLEEPIYKWYIDCIRKAEDKTGKEILKTYETVSELDADSENIKDWTHSLVKEKIQGIIIYDDQLCEDQTSQNIAVTHFTQFRKRHWTAVWLTQSHMSTDQRIRKNTRVLCIGQIATNEELRRISRGFSGITATTDQLEKYHQDIMKEGQHNFMTIDTTIHEPGEEYLRYRKNLAITHRPLPPPITNKINPQ